MRGKIIISIATDGLSDTERAKFFDNFKRKVRAQYGKGFTFSDIKDSFVGERDEFLDDVYSLNVDAEKLIKKPVKDIDFSVRAFNTLTAHKLNSIKAIMIEHQKEKGFSMSSTDPISGLLKLRNFGLNTLVEIEKLLNEYGFSLDTDIKLVR